MSEQLEVSKFTYRAWEQGKNEPSIKHLLKLSDMFRISIDYLVGNDEYSRNVLEPVKKSAINDRIESLIDEIKLEIEKEIDKKIKEISKESDN